MLIIAKSILHSGVRRARFVVLLLLSVTTGALSVTPGAGAEEPVVVAFGDSLTAGLGVSPAKAYPALLEARLRKEGYAYRVVNAGVSGDTTAGGLRRVDWALRLKPAIVIVELGANDALRGQELGGVRANLDTIVERFQASGARVLVAGMRVPTNYGERYGAGFERLFAEVAAKRKAAFMPFFLDGVAADARLNQADGIHPTAAGYRIIADRLWPYLRPLLRK
jgi:acyl-CoA thioesterase-1